MDSGKFFCPKCNNNGMYGYTNWINKVTINNERPTKEWIFYNKIKTEIKKGKCRFTNRKYFCFPWTKIGELTTKHNCCFCFECFCYVITCGCNFYYFIFYSALYILVLGWIDLISYFCCKTYQSRYNCLCLNDNNSFETKVIDNIDDKNKIWDHCRGAKEEDFIKYGKTFFNCSKCYRKEKTFLNFIPNPNDSTMEIIGDSDRSSSPQIPENYISLMFIKLDQNIQHSVACRLDETFESVEQKLFEDIDELQGKKYYYLCNGINICSNDDKAKTLRQLKLKNSDTIQIQQIDDNLD